MSHFTYGDPFLSVLFICIRRCHLPFADIDAGAAGQKLLHCQLLFCRAPEPAQHGNELCLTGLKAPSSGSQQRQPDKFDKRDRNHHIDRLSSRDSAGMSLRSTAFSLPGVSAGHECLTTEAASYWLLAKAEYYMLTTWAATLCRPDSKNGKRRLKLGQI